MMDEELVETNPPSVGERLLAARKAKKMSLEEIAAQTRIPQRHLESIEQSNWDNLPAPTYTVGFAKSYASAVGLDRTEIGEQLREEMGGERFVSTAVDVFEPADPARTMPKWLVLGAIGAVILVVALMSWLNNRSLREDVAPDSPAPVTASDQTPAAPVPQPLGPVVIAATESVWLQVYDLAGTNYFSGTLNPGQTFAVPASVTAPLLRTGKPESLRITVGADVAPPVGVPGKQVSDVSLRGADLMQAAGSPSGAAPSSSGPATSPPASSPQPRQVRPSPHRTQPATPRPTVEPAIPPADPAPTNGAQ